MGFFDKVKSAMNFVTGGAAKVTVEFEPSFAMPGEPVNVRVTVTSTGGAVNSTGVFVDISAHEQLAIPANTLPGHGDPIHYNRQTFTQEIQIAPGFQLGANETRQFEGQFAVPAHAQPTYDGPFADHDWGVRGRVAMSGNDPDSGFVKFVVGRRA